MEIKVLKAHPYQGTLHMAGDTYSPPDKFAKLLITIGKAEAVTALKSAQQASKDVSDFALENGVDIKEIKGSGKDGRIVKKDIARYMTRDMRAK